MHSRTDIFPTVWLSSWRFWMARAAVVASCIAAPCVFTSSSEAQRGSDTRSNQVRKGDEWVLLASQKVDRTQKSDRIDVRTARGRVKAVRLIARENGIDLSLVKITYAD